MRMRYCYALCLAAMSTAAGAQEQEQEPEREFALGIAGAVYQGAQREVESQKNVAPLVYYQSKRLSVVFTTLSYHFVAEGPVQLSVLGSARFDGYDPGDSPYLSGMRRSDAFDVGLEAALGDLTLSVVTDATSAHEGIEAALDYSYGIELGKFLVRLAAGLRWQNSDLADYYYGVRASEQVTRVVNGQIFQRTAYQVSDALIPKVGTLAMYHINPQWSVLGGAEVVFLPGTVKDSPIVGKSYQWGAFAGLAYHF